MQLLSTKRVGKIDATKQTKKFDILKWYMILNNFSISWAKRAAGKAWGLLLHFWRGLDFIIIIFLHCKVLALYLTPSKHTQPNLSKLTVLYPSETEFLFQTPFSEWRIRKNRQKKLDISNLNSQCNCSKLKTCWIVMRYLKKTTAPVTFEIVTRAMMIVPHAILS